MASSRTTTDSKEGNGAPSSIRIYHNPQCPRSREALEYLLQQGAEPEIVEYLKTPLTKDELRQLIRLLGIAPSSLIRCADFKRLGLEPTSDYEQLLQHIAVHPVLMDRPIVVMGKVARIGRPVEYLRDLFTSAPSRPK